MMTRDTWVKIGDGMATLFGLKACDTCRKALKEFQNAGREIEFRDVRDAPLSEGEIARFLAAFGEDLINRRSTTWRQLSEEERTHTAADLLSAHPTLMKRPVIEGEGGLTLGWDATARARHLGS